MSKITPFLWFDSELEEALELYGRVFPEVKVLNRVNGPDGNLFWGEFEIAGSPFKAMNAGPSHPFTEAVSFWIDCEDQAEVDHYWDALTADGGREDQCGWLKDKFGVSWQVIPRRLTELMSDPDQEAAGRATQAMLQMRKIVVADLESAFRGD